MSSFSFPDFSLSSSQPFGVMATNLWEALVEYCLWLFEFFVVPIIHFFALLFAEPIKKLLTPDPREAYLEGIANALTYEEWESYAEKLDKYYKLDIWRAQAHDDHYDHRLLYARLLALREARNEQDVPQLINLLRSGLVRNLGNMTSPKMFNRAYAGAKSLTSYYVAEMSATLQYLSTLPSDLNDGAGFTSLNQLELFQEARQSLGRSTLLLQGGAIFGMCHLGVVKALHLRGILPRIITGTATGALIAALVGIHTEDELLNFLNGRGIDLTAFDRRNNPRTTYDGPRLIDYSASSWFNTLLRRVRRYFREGYFLDVNVLQECVHANVGNLTFEEAYAKTKRVLNITVTTSGKGGVPTLLNYLTTPHVLIWSAAVASNVSSTSLYSATQMYCKDETGAIVPWDLSKEVATQSWRSAKYRDRESPLARLSELFNVNHFIVSQARPYIVPFLRPSSQISNPRRGGAGKMIDMLMHLINTEFHHRLKQLDRLDLLPASVRRMLVEETIPAAHITIVPEIKVDDWLKLLQNPTMESLEYWTLKGERSIWPTVAALKARCGIEVEIDKGYQLVRRRSSMESGISSFGPTGISSGQAPVQPWVQGDAVPRETSRRRRAVSMGPS